MKRFTLIIFIASISSSGCSYLDVVPDNIATIDYAFRSRVAAERYLFTCYSYMPADADIAANPAISAGDEFWYYPDYTGSSHLIAKGQQNSITPQTNYWAGAAGGKPLFRAIRDCNIFLENIYNVPDMDIYQKNMWAGEVIFLKAYYHYYLLRLYGPIPLIKVNLPITTSTEDTKAKRMPVDSCVNYIVHLLNEADSLLPPDITDRTTELGRITKVIAKALKADVLVTAASPLFNGNGDYATFKDHDGIQLFNTVFDPVKWEVAAEACKQSIAAAEGIGHKLYEFSSTNTNFYISPVTKVHMDIRNSVAERWNSELVWGNSNSLSSNIQRFSFIRALNIEATDLTLQLGILSPPLKIVEQFYSKNGVPITEDKTYNYAGRYGLKVAAPEDRLVIESGYTTVALNFDREPRFYADLAFDGSSWYGQGKFIDTVPYYAKMKQGQLGGKRNENGYTVSGYVPKKLFNWENVASATGITVRAYPWPLIRLADLYLLYAEALNEVKGPNQESYDYVNKVRARAGLQTLESSWITYSNNPSKYTSKNGLREIIQQERLIELSFEGKRFYDIRRWKRAFSTLNAPIEGFSVTQQEAPLYYQKRLIFNQTFNQRDYFWPIRESDIIVNRNLVQNPGW